MSAIPASLRDEGAGGCGIGAGVVKEGWEVCNGADLDDGVDLAGETGSRKVLEVVVKFAGSMDMRRRVSRFDVRGFFRIQIALPARDDARGDGIADDVRR
jgi:hypothetical protein